jgi:four helix bundle protein
LKVQRFEDLEAWQIALELANKVYEITKQESVRRDFGFVDQIRRAAISIMNNIAEGFERGSNKDFVRFLFIARGSAGEVRSLLYLGLDQGYLTNAEFSECRDLCIRSGQIIWALIKGLRKRVDFITGLKIIIATAFVGLGLTHI